MKQMKINSDTFLFIKSEYSKSGISETHVNVRIDGENQEKFLLLKRTVKTLRALQLAKRKYNTSPYLQYRLPPGMVYCSSKPCRGNGVILFFPTKAITTKLIYNTSKVL